MAIKEEYLAKTYVYDTREVRLTGRIAKKKKRSGKEVEVWEVCPVSVANTAPKNTAFNKWCNPMDLLHIEGENKLIKPVEEPIKKPEAQILNE